MEGEGNFKAVWPHSSFSIQWIVEYWDSFTSVCHTSFINTNRITRLHLLHDKFSINASLKRQRGVRRLRYNTHLTISVKYETMHVWCQDWQILSGTTFNYVTKKEANSILTCAGAYSENTGMIPQSHIDRKPILCPPLRGLYPYWVKNDPTCLEIPHMLHFRHGTRLQTSKFTKISPKTLWKEALLTFHLQHIIIPENWLSWGSTSLAKP